MNLTLGYSTCPNDTFIFDAMVHGKVDTEGLGFSVKLADVEELNQNAFEGSLDVTKLSYHAYAHVADRYKLLTSGSALGYKNGPLLISKHKIYPDEIKDLSVAIPGEYTTANLLFSIFFPEIKDKKSYLFSDIEEAVLVGDVDAGLIIHENRFTYKGKGLKKVIDLGEEWEKTTGLAIPLGGIVIQRDLEPEIQQKVNRVLRRSVEYAFNHPMSGYDYVKMHARELNDQVIRQHIELYVNGFTRDLGKKGREAISVLYNIAAGLKLIQAVPDSIFVE